MDNTNNQPRILSLCTGMRGLERGIERACVRLNWPPPKAIAHVEIEAFIAWNLVKQMEQGVLDPAPVWSNLKTFNWNCLRGKVSGITGGYPCQPFSVAGKRKGTDDPRHLWPYIKEGVRTIRPIWCFFENVPGHLTMGYREVKSELEELGNTVKEGIYSAEEVGAPHSRERLFILAITTGVDQVDSGCSEPSRKKSIDGREEYVQERNDIRNNIRSTGQGLANSKGELCQFAGNTWNRRTGFTDSNKNDVADSESGGTQRNSKWESGQERNIQIKDLDSLRESKTMADTNSSGENTKQSELWTNSTKQPSCNSRVSGKGENEKIPGPGWPARPNEKQYEWEPRRIESRVGYTFNGYNFREDLLRMVGNGVVEQTAEIAFIDLLKKHGII